MLPLLIFCMVAVGCAILPKYPGPKLPPEKVAKLRGTSNFYYVVDVECIIQAAGGESVYGGIWSSGDTVEMLPCKHEFTIMLLCSTYTTTR